MQPSVVETIMFKTASRLASVFSLLFA